LTISRRPILRAGDSARCVLADTPDGQCSNSGTNFSYGNWEIRSKLLSTPGERAVGLLNRADTPQTITVPFKVLRKDNGTELNGTTPTSGLHNVTSLEYVWSKKEIGSLSANPSGTVILGTGQQAQDVPYTCDTQKCTSTDVPAHGLIRLKIAGTSD